MTDRALRDLCRLLDESGARLTLDLDRCNALPCVVCGELPRPTLTLRCVGHYIEAHPGNIRAGDEMRRPVCDECWRAIAEENTP